MAVKPKHRSALYPRPSSDPTVTLSPFSFNMSTLNKRAAQLHLEDSLRHLKSLGGLGLSQAQAPLARSALDKVSSTKLNTDALPDFIPGLSKDAGRSSAAAAAGAGKAKAVLNVFSGEHGAAARPLGEVLTEMSVALAEVCEAVLKRQGHEVVYKDVAATEAWPRYLYAVEALATASVDGIAEVVRKGGLYNMYNGLIIHAKLIYGHPTTLAKRGTFFNSAAYMVCGTRVSSPDLEHMVLRCKASDDSPLGKLKLQKKDPRMHFILNCGARSCPPIRVLQMDAVEEGIVANTRYFIGLHCNIDGRKVLLSRLWKWFRNDFTPNTTRNPALLAWIAANASDDANGKLVGLVGVMNDNPAMDAGEAVPNASGESGAKVTDGKVRVKFQR